MATNVKISQFPTDTTITGNEIVTGLDGNTNMNFTLQQIADWIIAQVGGGGGGGDTLIMASSGDTLIMSGSGDTLIMA